MTPRLKLGYLRMGLVVVEGDHIIAKNRPEGVGNQTANSSTMKEFAYMRVAVCITPGVT